MIFEWERQLEILVRHYHAQNWNDSRIAEFLGKSSETIRQCRKRLDLPVLGRDSWERCGPRSRLEKHDAKIRAWNSEGKSDGETALELDCSSGTVRNYRIKIGLPAVCSTGSRPGHKNASWKGGKTVDKSGYVLVLRPDHPRANSSGYIREHRLVMEQALGRILNPHEVVHHRDGDKTNNDVANLQLFDRNSQHLKSTRKGKKPQWTDKGLQKIAAGVEKSRQKRLGVPHSED